MVAPWSSLPPSSRRRRLGPPMVLVLAAGDFPSRLVVVVVIVLVVDGVGGWGFLWACVGVGVVHGSTPGRRGIGLGVVPGPRRSPPPHTVSSPSVPSTWLVVAPCGSSSS